MSKGELEFEEEFNMDDELLMDDELDMDLDTFEKAEIDIVNQKTILDLINSGEVNKASIGEIAQEVADEIIDQGMSMEYALKIKVFTEYLGQIGTLINDDAIDQTEKLAKEERVLHGLPLVIKTSGKTYNYSVDPEVKKIEDRMASDVKALADRKAILKKYAGLVTGEVTLPDGTKGIAPVIDKPGSTSFSTTIKAG